MEAENVSAALKLKPTRTLFLPVNTCCMMSDAPVSSWDSVISFCLFPFQGQMTGVCVDATKTCEVLAWCPVEDDNTIPE